jgi:enediyne biosynthesis protein E4
MNTPRPMRRRPGFWPLLLGTLALSCLPELPGCSKSSTPSQNNAVSQQADGPTWFEDVTDAVGLDFVHDPGPQGAYFMPHIMGSGGAFFDCDGDGLLDIYLLQDAGPKSKAINRLYKQRSDGTFQDVTEGSGLGIAGYNMGVAIADVNNDGLPDVLVTQYRGIKLFLNKGGGRFEDITDEAGLSDPLWGTSAAFFDFDRDGWLDLVVVNYVDYDPTIDCHVHGGVKEFCAPKAFSGTSTRLFRNRGPRAAAPGVPAARVHFEDVSFASGVGRIPGRGLGVVCADFDGDGWPDIFVANDAQPNRLWINRRDGTFVEEAYSRGVAVTAMGQAFAGMGIAMGDITNSGLLDLYVTHLAFETNTLWKQGPRGLFRDRSVEYGLTATRGYGTGFGTLLADFTNKGALDLAVVNGRVNLGGDARNTDLGSFWETYAERNQLLSSDGKGKFRDVSASNKAFCNRWNVARGLACGDFNNDGAPDLLVTSIGARARLYRNVAPDRGHWVKVRALDPKRKREAYGAEVRVRAGGREWLRLVNPAESYLTSSSPIAHFGLGAASVFDSILVLWPDGSRETFPGQPADRVVEVRKGEGQAP